MKENEKELLDLDEEGNIKDKKVEKANKKEDNNPFKIIVTIIVIVIIICAIIMIYKFYKKTNHIELIIFN